MVLDSYQAVLPGSIKDLVEDLKKFPEGRMAVRTGLNKPQGLGDNALHNGGFIPHEKSTASGPTDDDELIELVENEQIPTMHGVANHHTAENYHHSYDYEHESNSWAGM